MAGYAELEEMEKILIPEDTTEEGKIPSEHYDKTIEEIGPMEEEVNEEIKDKKKSEYFCFTDTIRGLKEELEKEQKYSQGLKENLEKILKEKKEIAEELRELKASKNKIKKQLEALMLEVEE